MSQIDSPAAPCHETVLDEVSRHETVLTVKKWWEARPPDERIVLGVVAELWSIEEPARLAGGSPRTIRRRVERWEGEGKALAARDLMELRPW